MPSPKAKHIATVVFSGVAMLIGVVLLSTIESHRAFMPWSEAHIQTPSLKGHAKFGLLHLQICRGAGENGRPGTSASFSTSEGTHCVRHDYDWLATYTRLWGSDVGSCTSASKGIIAALTIATFVSFCACVLAITQLFGRAKSFGWVNTLGGLLLLGVIGFATSAGVWNSRCGNVLGETTTVALTWGFALAIVAMVSLFVSFLIELISPAGAAEAEMFQSTGNAGLLDSQIAPPGTGYAPLPHASLQTGPVPQSQIVQPNPAQQTL